MKKSHKQFFKDLTQLCCKYGCVFDGDEILFRENMPDTDELTGQFKLIEAFPYLDGNGGEVRYEAVFVPKEKDERNLKFNFKEKKSR